MGILYWTEDEINELKAKNLYNINTAKEASAETGLNFTFGGFTYAKDSSGNANTTYANEISNGTVITSRNESVSSLYGTPEYGGWQILESEVNDGKTYVKKLVHAGSPENFVYKYTKSMDGWRAEYILSGGQRGTNTYQLRDWSMYEDKKLKANNYISDVHVMTKSELLSTTSNINKLYNINAYYWIATSYSSNSLCFAYNNGSYGGGDNGMGYCFGIRLVIQMNEGVYIASGDGTEANPYVLGKN